MSESIVYFDGLCNLCDRFVRFIVTHDRRGRFRFAPLQGTTAQLRLGDRFSREQAQTIVLEEPRRFRVRSDAALAILAGLGGPWRLAGVFRAVPRPLRDAVYDYVARRRFDWYARRDACRVPTAGELDRFLP